ncbi:hypothetical protein GCM10025776_22810 [Corallincola platygyrae]
MLIPITILMIEKVTGKVNPTAARGSVPNILIKKVSTRLKLISSTMPRQTGIVILFNVAGMGAVSRSLIN